MHIYVLIYLVAKSKASFLDSLSLINNFDDCLMQDFHVDALENFIGVASMPKVAIFDSDPSNRPFLIKFFNNPNTKVRSYFLF